MLYKYVVLIREWGGLYYAFVGGVYETKIALWKNIRVTNWTAE